VAELARRGVEVTGIDYTPEEVERSAARCQAQGLRAELVQADVLSYRPAQPFDAVYEQTCLCALHPQHWRGYSAQLAHWLRPAGTLWALFMQVLRPAAAEQGLIQGPPYHCDITAMRSLFTEPDWAWPAPPYARVPHPNRAHELAVPLKRH
jgi:cyclopropane fatty-acyl-phospholipid synthase-like methyltransferase